MRTAQQLKVLLVTLDFSLVNVLALRHWNVVLTVLSLTLLVPLLLVEMLRYQRATSVLVAFIPPEPVEIPHVRLSRRQFKVGVFRHSHDESSAHRACLVAVEPLPNALLVEKMPALRDLAKLFGLFIAQVADGTEFLLEMSCNFARVSNCI